jgi:hypothetical protein
VGGWSQATPEADNVAIINEVLARELFPGENPVGRRIAVGGATKTAIGPR